MVPSVNQTRRQLHKQVVMSVVYRKNSFCAIVLRGELVTTSRRMRQSNTAKSVRVVPYAIFFGTELSKSSA